MKILDIYHALDLASDHLGVSAQQAITGVKIDSREIQVGDLFVALSGAQVDGHDYLAAAVTNGAVAALVAQAKLAELSSVIDSQSLVIIPVPDVIQAFGQIAQYWRRQFTLPVVAITGSQGKTTVREMTASILQLAYGADAVLVAEKNYNNHLGVPLTLCRLNAKHKVAVLELGMNHLGEIDYLTRLCQPTVSTITLASLTHSEGVPGGLVGIAKAKGEIFAALPNNSTAVLNQIDTYYAYWLNLLHGQTAITFGQVGVSDVYYQAKTKQYMTPIGPIALDLPLPGVHNQMNACCAIALVQQIHPAIDLKFIKHALEQLSSVPGRLQFKTNQRGAIIINDSYNSSPASVAAALNVLAEQPGRKVAILGDMAEIGTTEVAEHQALADQLMASHVDEFIAIGPLMYHTFESYSGENKHYFTDKLAAKNYLLSISQQDTVFLVKGSRSMAMEQVVEWLNG